MANVSQFQREYTEIYKILALDEEVRELLEIKSNQDVVKRIFKRKYMPEIETGKVHIRLYQTPSRRARNDYTFWDYFEVKVTGGQAYEDIVWKLTDRIINLLHKNCICGREIEFISMLGNEFAPTEMFEIGIRFRFKNYI